MRKKILAYALKYEGNYDKIHKAIKHDEFFESVQYKGEYVTRYDDEYPKSLLQLNKPPYILFYKGNVALLKEASIGVVGSRRAIRYAIEVTQSFIAKQEQTTIVSGMAKGIDTIAHKAAISNGHQTIAVLGCGIDFVYPYENESLYNYLSINHLVISEYPSAIKPKPYFFPFRNRIIAALSDTLYVMQANLRSGTLLTVNEALELNKDVYVLPYRIDDKSGMGCNMLIQQGANMLMAEDV